MIIRTNSVGSIHIEDPSIPQPFSSWKKTYNGLGFFWDAPVPCPIDDKIYFWNEETMNWEEDK